MSLHDANAGGSSYHPVEPGSRVIAGIPPALRVSSHQPIRSQRPIMAYLRKRAPNDGTLVALCCGFAMAAPHERSHAKEMRSLAANHQPHSRSSDRVQARVSESAHQQP
jgi:hypothetical protein